MENLQSLLEKINREGVEKADAEAKKIVDAAKARAEAIVSEAKAEAAKTRAAAEKDAQAYAERAAMTVKESARDLIIGVQGSLTALLEKLLADQVQGALADPKNAQTLVMKAIDGLSGSGEIVCGADLANALKAELPKLGTFAIRLDDTLGAGFSVKFDGGRVEHDFTTATIAAELAKRLRPDLAALVKAQ